MARDIDLTSQQWLDIVFKDKNKSFGAYQHRKNSNKRHIIAIAVVLIVILGVWFLPSLIQSIASKNKDAAAEQVEQTTIVSVLDVEEQLDEEIVQPIQEEVPPPPPLKETIAFVPPVIGENVEEDQMLVTQQELTESTADISIATVEGVADGVDIADLQDHVVVVQEEKAPPKPLEIAEVMPSFPGGPEELYKWLNSNLVYPPIAEERGVQGTVTLRFVVKEDGSIGEVQILKPVDTDLDKEAKRVVSKLPKFIPGRQNGRPVQVWFTLPVKFRLK